MCVRLATARGPCTSRALDAHGVAFRAWERRQHLGRRIISRLDTQPAFPLSTLAACPSGHATMTRGQCESLRLHRQRLSLPTSCRLYPALSPIISLLPIRLILHGSLFKLAGSLYYICIAQIPIMEKQIPVIAGACSNSQAPLGATCSSIQAPGCRQDRAIPISPLLPMPRFLPIHWHGPCFLLGTRGKRAQNSATQPGG